MMILDNQTVSPFKSFLKHKGEREVPLDSIDDVVVAKSRFYLRFRRYE